MNAALWGLSTAFAWGGADFIARFSGRAIGHRLTLLGMLTVGSLFLSVFVWFSGVTLVWVADGVWLLILTGVGIMFATLLLYRGLALGPVTVVAPIVGSYPALNAVLALVLGLRPTALEWLAMGGVMMGVVVVARAARSFEGDAGYSRAHLSRSIAISLASAFWFAVGIAAAQQAIPIYGELQTVLFGRWISLAGLIPLLLWRRETVRVPGTILPLLVAQGLLDSCGYIALLYGSSGDGAIIAVVVSSCFGAVTVLLARVFLHEAMTLAQWCGIFCIIAGVATLSAQ